MTKWLKTLTYPENAYCDILYEDKYPDLPPDAKETLSYLTETLPEREADMFMLEFREKWTHAAISEKYGVSIGRVSQIIHKAKRKLRYPEQIKILRMGREAYLRSTIAENEERKRQYANRIAELEAAIQKQAGEISEDQVKLAALHKQADPTHDVLSTSIDVLDLSIRPRNCLDRARLKTIMDILDYGDLYTIRNMGQKGVREVQHAVRAFTKAAGIELGCEWMSATNEL